MHCLEPSCVAACLVGGLLRTAEGAVVYDPDRCIGCRYCMLACPLHVPRYEWHSRLPFMRKCTLCIDRLRQGKIPACVEACPHEALSFGMRTGMLGVARERLAREPGRYLPHVWGEREWGGTSVLYLSDVDLDAIGLSRDATRSVPSITDPVIHATPHVALGVATAMAALSWVIGRRQLLAGAVGEGEGSDEHH
jgi:formate dehydrogenase iron-sulfur subunit